jgi:hypothetical protein
MARRAAVATQGRLLRGGQWRRWSWGPHARIATQPAMERRWASRRIRCARVSTRLDDGMPNAEINRESAALERMFDLALRQAPPRVLQKPYIRMLQEWNVREGLFERHEFEARRAALPQPVRLTATFAYYRGWRKQRILEPAWDCIDLQGRRADLPQAPRRTGTAGSCISQGQCPKHSPPSGARPTPSTPCALGCFSGTARAREIFGTCGVLHAGPSDGRASSPEASGEPP